MIQNVWAVGRNYAAHAKELGNAVPENPLIFLKAGSTVTMNEEFSLPTHSADVHHELEIALRFGAAPGLKFDAVHLALDLTARDLQEKLKAAGQPWTLAKSFKESCPLSRPLPLPLPLPLPRPMNPSHSTAIPHFSFELSVNGETRQRGNTIEMIYNFEALHRYVTDRFPVCPGDLLLTGTPSGVARLNRGDRISAWAKSADGHELHAAWRVRL